MKYALSTAVALAFLSGPVLAQTTVTTTADTVEIVPEQRTVIKKYITEQKSKPVKLKERVTVGGMVPADVEFQPLPSTIVTSNPRLKGYSYFSSDTGTYIVDPSSRKVITTID